MSVIEKKIPKLIPGYFHFEGSKLVFESEDEKIQVYLPKECQEAAALINNKRTVKEIISTLFESRGEVGFKNLFICLSKLKEGGALENPDDFASEVVLKKNIYEKRLPIISKPLLYIRLLENIKLTSNPPVALFYIFAFIVTAMAVFFVIKNPLPRFANNFLRYEDSYFYGFLLFNIANSILISGKTLIKTLFSFLISGKVFHLSLQLNLFSLSLRVSDEAAFTQNNRALQIVYTIGCVISHLALTSILYFIFGGSAIVDNMLILSYFLTLADLDPFRKSDLSRLFSMFYSEDNLKNLAPYLKKKVMFSIVKPGGKIKGESLFVIYATIAITWLMLSLGIVNDYLNEMLPNLWVALSTGPTIEKISSAVILIGMVSISWYLLLDILSIFTQSILNPFKKQVSSFKQGLGSKDIDPPSKKEAIQILKKTALFENVNDEKLALLAEKAKYKSFSEGIQVLIQNSEGNGLHILLDGEVEVIYHHPTGAEEHVARIKPGTIFGETAVLEKKLRTADVVCTKDSTTMFLSRSLIEDLVSPDELNFILDKIKLNQSISSSKLFSQIPKEAVSLFTDLGELVHYKSGDTIINEGDKDEDFYLIARGKVIVLKGMKQVGVLEQGEFFGEIALITHQPRTATIQSVDETLLLKISSEVFWKVLAENLNLGVYLESVAEERMGFEEVHA